MLNDELNEAILKSYKEYLRYGERSNKKLIPLHSFVSQSLKTKLKEGYEVNSLGYGTKREERFEGGLYDKSVDIAILKNGTQIGAIAVKFVTSNYSQNANNYIENMIGETFNIRSGNLVYSQILIIKNPLPYLNRDRTIERMETINAGKIKKYQKLLSMKTEQLAVPNSLFFKLIDTGDSKIYQEHIGTKHIIRDEDVNQKLLKNAKITSFNIESVGGITDDIKHFYNDHSDFENFILNFIKMI